MARSQATASKKEREKRKRNEKKDKLQRKEERKTNNNKGKGFESMIAYVDEFGRLTSTPPDPARRSQIKAEDIEIGVPKQAPIDPADLIRKGTVTFFNESKGYGFIRDIESQESIFVHASVLESVLKENDKVTFEVESGHRGLNAVNVKLVS